MPSFKKKKNLRNQLEERLDDLTTQTAELSKQVADRAPGVRDQLLAAIPDKDQLRAALPDKDQLLEIRDELFERLPESVSERLPEKVKPKRSRLKKVAILGAITGIGAAAFAAVRGKSSTPPPPPAPFPQATRPTPTPPPTPAPAPAAAPASVPPTDGFDAPDSAPKA
ncbi:hypothetical protein [Aeromicrobium sp.]|uniref:hypothetical protein n=1 Tax=Aeromicrobium sp. TaxID=1871063 RepID=UPI0019886BD3|nr:hypothetical protein [Aeromicrobium sp.]MBC7632146.1 hypothetical protein [Aeromicrobium sp.]